MRKEGVVSILIPCYNHERFVDDCLDSILNQTYRKFEVIICDDASKDGSLQKIYDKKPEFDKAGIRFVILKNDKNRGLTGTINHTLEHAEGEYFKTIASDDMLCEDYLEKMVGYMQEHANVKYVFCNCTRVTEESTYPVKEKDIIGPLLSKLTPCDEHMLIRNYENNEIPAPSMLFRMEVIDEFGNYDASIGIEDLDMTLRILAKYPDGIRCIEECLVYYRANSTSMSANTKAKGVRKRAKKMFVYSVKIAKKHRHSVPKEVYKKRIKKLYIDYIVLSIKLFFSK
ncbi:MAG: glycosyltransferase family 2 protein [Lachnospiraceae bacterium]|nr:glycosyltransferase family 2 protein [Lachnospiraceae bacterium]